MHRIRGSQRQRTENGTVRSAYQRVTANDTEIQRLRSITATKGVTETNCGRDTDPEEEETRQLNESEGRSVKGTSARHSPDRYETKSVITRFR